MNKIIEIEELSKSFGDIDAVRGVNLSIERGEMFGLVGPDGAGKTTTLRILCGLIRRFDGNVKIFDLNVIEHQKKIQNRIGYLSQKFSLYGDLSVDENIEFFADIHNVKNFKERRNKLLEFTRLVRFRDRLADNLSGGMKQKLALASSLIHKPDLLFLDEPTTGVDPVSRRDFWKILSDLSKQGITIIMTTPYLDEAERCNRVALMHKGKLIAVDSPDKIKQSISKKVLEIVCSPSREAFKLLKVKNYEAQLFGDKINVIIDAGTENYNPIIEYLINAGIEIIDSRTTVPSLENVFIHLIKKAG